MAVWNNNNNSNNNDDSNIKNAIFMKIKVNQQTNKKYINQQKKLIF